MFSSEDVMEEHYLPQKDLSLAHLLFWFYWYANCLYHKN